MKPDERQRLLNANQKLCYYERENKTQLIFENLSKRSEHLRS